MTDTGEMIKMIRESLSWPQVYLSEKADVSVHTIRYIEGRTDCKVSTFEKLLEAMGYEIEILKKEK